MIILLSLKAILTVIAIWSLNDQYHCSSLCISVLVDGKLQSTDSVESGGVHPLGLLLIFSPLSCCLLCLCMILLYWWWCLCLVFLHLFLWLCLGSQSTVNSCDLVYIVFWCCIGVSIVILFEACVIGFQDFFKYCYKQFVVYNHTDLTDKALVMTVFQVM